MTANYQPSAEDLVPPLPLRTPSSRLLVAYSGGLDSTVLLHALATLKIPGLVAVHVHHGLQIQADGWVEHCARFCASLSVPLTLCRARIDPAHEAGPEAAAREARYALLRDELRAGDLLVTAHHRDDQAETVLMRLLRGSGVHGLAAMRPLSNFAPGRLWRPLLDQPRERLFRYAEAQQLTWIDDPHNSDPRYTRSWLREELLPKLRERWPQAVLSLSRSARLASESAELLDVLARQDADAAATGSGLSVSALQGFSAARRHNLLRCWLRDSGFEVPAAAMLDRIDEELIAAPRDASPLVQWPGCELRRYRDVLYAMPPLLREPEVGAIEHWRSGIELDLDAGRGLLIANAPPPCDIRIRRARDGESFRTGPQRRARSLKNLFQEAGVPPWLRSRLPVLELDGVPACVTGVGSTEAWRELVVQTGWKPLWQHSFRGMDSPLPL